MRLLIDHECGAVAGGGTSFCEQLVTTVFIVAGAAGGSCAGGIGTIPGAAYGAVVAEATKGWICGTDDDESEEEEYEEEEDSSSEELTGGGGSYGQQFGTSHELTGPQGIQPFQLVAHLPKDDQT